MRSQRLAVASVCVALASCGHDAPTIAASPHPPEPSAQRVLPAPPAPSPVDSGIVEALANPPPPVVHVPPPTDEEAKALAKASNAFSFAMWRKIANKKGDRVFSPFSAESALTMTWLGAKGSTAQQMQKVLGFAIAAPDAADITGRFTQSLGGPVTIQVSNRLFGEKTYEFEPSFLDATSKLFGAPLEALDFKGAPDPSRVHINEWVSKQTHDRIKEVVPQGGITPLTRLQLVNTIYFLGDWETQFPGSKTRTEPFHTSATAEHYVTMMRQRLIVDFAEDASVSLVDLPYVGGAFSMTFVVPKKIDGLDAVEKKLSADGFDAWIAAKKKTFAEVIIPQFKIDPAEPTDLGEALKGLGMRDVFNPDAADLTGIAKSTPGDRLYVDKVFQKAFIKVDEKGTEAAAATAVSGVHLTSSETEPQVHFLADRPFLFFLRDTKSNAILFAGRVADPVRD